MSKNIFSEINISSVYSSFNEKKAIRVSEIQYCLINVLSMMRCNV